jgi:hypothetical protein
MDENPYQPPRFDELPKIGPDAGPGVDASGLTEAEIRAFVGKNAGYYLRKWPSAKEQYGRARGFNWAAFLLSGLWLSYRKMYRITFLMFGILVVEEVLEEIAVTSGFANEKSLAVVGRTVGLIFSILCGAFGNAWYFAHARRAIGVIRGRDLPDEAYHEALARRGGTSVLATLGLLCLFIGVLFVVGFVIALTLPSD